MNQETSTATRPGHHAMALHDWAITDHGYKGADEMLESSDSITAELRKLVIEINQRKLAATEALNLRSDDGDPHGMSEFLGDFNDFDTAASKKDEQA